MRQSPGWGGAINERGRVSGDTSGRVPELGRGHNWGKASGGLVAGGVAWGLRGCRRRGRAKMGRGGDVSPAGGLA